MQKATRQPRNGWKISRRNFLKTFGAVGATLAAGAEVSLLGGKAPLFAQTRTVHLLAWSHFIPAADELTRKQAAEFEKMTGVKINFETINANDLPARATAAVEGGTGPDIFQLQWNQPHLYADGIEDHTKLAQELDSDQVYPYLKAASNVNGIYRGVPYYGIGNAFAYRKDIFEEVGIKKVPDTWEEFLEAGKKLKQFGMPVGQTLGHTFGDAPTFAYPLLWCFGGQEVDENQKVAINSKETAAAVDFMREFWTAACDEGGLAWDDSSNNRAFFAETIAATLNGASIYFVARYSPEKAPPGLADKIGHFLMPQGPNGRFHTILPFTHCIMKYSKNKEPATEFIRFLMDKKNYEDYITVQKGYGLGRTPDWENHPMWQEDPAVEPYRLNAKYGRTFGYAGPYDRKASEVQAKYIIIDLFARAVKGEPTKDVIAWAEGELKNVYERS